MNKPEARSKYGFSMYPNYLKAIDDFTKGDDKLFGRYMRILTYYGIYGKDITENEVEKLFFTTVIASVDSSVEKRSNGATGGRGNKAFKKPTVEEIKAFCDERKNKVDAEAFFNFYESKGWKVGKAPMKDWKACVLTWEKNSKKSAPDSVLHNSSEVF